MGVAAARIAPTWELLPQPPANAPPPQNTSNKSTGAAKIPPLLRSWEVRTMLDLEWDAPI